MKSLDPAALRKRVLLFYFAAGVNVLMGLYVLSAGSAVAQRGTLWLIAFVFIAFGGINYYMARLLAKRWEAHVRQHNAANQSTGEQPPD